MNGFRAFFYGDAEDDGANDFRSWALYLLESDKDVRFLVNFPDGWLKSDFFEVVVSLQAFLGHHPLSIGLCCPQVVAQVFDQYLLRPSKVLPALCPLVQPNGINRVQIEGMQGVIGEI